MAAFIGEPIQGAAGVLMPPSTYWPEIQRICKKYDVLLMLDEVITGYGRTGEWFAAQSMGIKPDTITTAKRATNDFMGPRQSARCRLRESHGSDRIESHANHTARITVRESHRACGPHAGHQFVCSTRSSCCPMNT